MGMERKCKKCGRKTGGLYSNPMTAGQLNVEPSVCKSCKLDIEQSAVFYAYYY